MRGGSMLGVSFNYEKSIHNHRHTAVAGIMFKPNGKHFSKLFLRTIGSNANTVQWTAVLHG